MSAYNIQTTQMRSKKYSVVRIKGIMEECDDLDQKDKRGKSGYSLDLPC